MSEASSDFLQSGQVLFTAQWLFVAFHAPWVVELALKQDLIRAVCSMISMHHFPLLMSLSVFTFLMITEAYTEAIVCLKESFAEDEQTIKSGVLMGFCNIDSQRHSRA